MKKDSILKTLALVGCVLLVSFALIRCTKTGTVAGQLDRKLPASPDSGIFAAFYDTTLIGVRDVTPDVNDKIVSRGVLSIVKENCATASCHGGLVSPKFTNYTDIKNLVVAGNPDGSKLWQLITTNDFDKAMPPVSISRELSTTDKVIIYNWIKNGAKESPTLLDFRPAAIKLITTGCASGNCHNEATATGSWARKGSLGVLSPTDTTQFFFQNPLTLTITNYCQLANKTLMNQVWTAYKDSVKKFYTDTLLYASFRPFKIFNGPYGVTSTRGPLNSYDDILMDIMYPKSVRSNSGIVYTNNGSSYYVRGNYLNATSALVTRIDSTLLLANPYTGVWATSHQGDMAYSDGGLKSSDIALIKAWYFADPNIPNVWKYGTTGQGIFKYRKSGTIITQ